MKTFASLFVVYVFLAQFAYSQTISVDAFTNTFYCDTNTLEVSFEIDGTFGGGNVFTAELSDGDGNFSSPITIGTLSLSGTFSNSTRTISGLLSGVTASDTNYLVRVTSSNPSITDTLKTQNLNIGFRNEADTLIYGDNEWRAYYYANVLLAESFRLYENYLGYYTVSDVSIDAANFYDSSATPAGTNFFETALPVATYVGCRDNSSAPYERYYVVYKRDGISCGRYQLDVGLSKGEGVKFIVDGVEEYKKFNTSNTNPYSATNVWEGNLTPDSKLIVQFSERNKTDRLRFTLRSIGGGTSGATSDTWKTGVTTTDWNTASNWTSGTVPDILTNVTLNSGSSSYPILTTKGNFANSLTINSGASIQLNTGSELEVFGDFTNNGTLTHNDGIITLSGCKEATISGSSTTTFSSLQMNKYVDTLDVTLARDVNVADTLYMTAGRMQTSTSNMLTVTSTGSTIGGSNSSFVEGPMEKVGTSSFIFPVGKDSMIAQIGISNLSGSSTFRAQYYNVAPSINDVQSPLVRPSSLEYWSLDQTSGTSQGNVSLYWSDTAFSKINNAASLSVARLSSSGLDWSDEGNSAVSFGTSGSITSDLVPSDSLSGARFFTFASTNASFNPLPVSIAYFKGSKLGDNFKLEWGTSYEYINEYFIIERAVDGFQFDSVGMVEGKGNSINLSKYEYYDNADFTFDNVYYRLKQVDYNGEFSYSKIISFDNASSSFITLENDFMVYPNPFDDRIILSFNNLSEDQEIRVFLYNYSGKIVKEDYTSLTELGDTEIALNTEDISSGNYILKAITNDVDINFVLVKH